MSTHLSCPQIHYMLHFYIFLNLNGYINGSFFTSHFQLLLIPHFLLSVFSVIGCRYEVFPRSRKCIIRNVRITCDFDGKLIGLWALKLVLSSAKLSDALFTFAFVKGPFLDASELLSVYDAHGWLCRADWCSQSC